MDLATLTPEERQRTAEWVAYHFRRARKHSGMTQRYIATKLTPPGLPPIYMQTLYFWESFALSRGVKGSVPSNWMLPSALAWVISVVGHSPGECEIGKCVWTLPIDGHADPRRRGPRRQRRKGK